MNPSPSDVASESLRDEPLDELLELDPELVIAQILSDPNLVQHVRAHAIGMVSRRWSPIFAVDSPLVCNVTSCMYRFLLPSAGYPMSSAMATEQADVRVRITDRQKFGVRLEVVLPRPSECETSLLVEVIATTPT